MASVTFAEVEKTYRDGTLAVDKLNLEIGDGEFIILVGPSGCGKTTALRMVAGLEDITGGELLIGDARVNELEPRERDVAMVFQNYALYPHMSVFDNIGFPLASQGVPKKEITSRVTSTASLLGLGEHLKRRPRNLSGGQRQRVAMGRAIIRRPRVFLMDEPLSNLDAKLRVQMRAEIAELQQELGVTTIYVTHDQVEAMTMGDRIAVMRKGVLQQLGKPQELYDTPTNLFVATFVGSPAMNLFDVDVRDSDGAIVAALGEQELRVPEASAGALRPYTGRRVALGMRPEHLVDGALSKAAYPQLDAQVSLVETLGFEQLIHLRVQGRQVTTEDVLEVARDVDEGVIGDTLDISNAAGHVSAVARFDAETRIAEGDKLRLGVRPDKMLFFDLETGSALRS